MNVAEARLDHADEDRRKRRRQQKTSFWLVVAIVVAAAAIPRLPDAATPVSERSLIPPPEGDEPWNLATATTPLVSRCGAQTISGGDDAETHSIEMGKISGTFSFAYDTLSIPDAITVSYEGRSLHDTLCVGDTGIEKLFYNYNGTSSRITVRVKPNCKGTKGTGWKFTVACPQ